jgi:hypothetical protein
VQIDERKNMIAYIYRPKRQRNGKQVFNRIWRARLKLNGDAKARDISLNCADKQTAEQKLRDTQRVSRRIGHTGMMVVVRLSAFIMLCIGVEITWNGVKALLAEIGIPG